MLLEQQGYVIYPMGINVLAIHQSAPTSRELSLQDGVLRLR